MKLIDVRSKVVEGTGVIYPGPYLNQLRGEAIEARCREMMESGVDRLVINFAETDLVNSIGISLLIGVVEAVNESGGRLVLSNLNDTNRELFDVLGILPQVEVSNDEPSALAALSTSEQIGAA